MSDVIRVLRVIEYVGERDWVEQTVANSIHGEKCIGRGNVIRAATIGITNEIIARGADQAGLADHDNDLQDCQEGLTGGNA